MKGIKMAWLTAYFACPYIENRVEANTYSMTWSPLTFGPDGPWQAVQMQIGSQESVVSLYPGGEFPSYFLTPSVCSNSSLGTVCYAQTAGLYDPELSRSAQFTNVSLIPGFDYTGGGLQIAGDAEPSFGTDIWTINNMPTLTNMDMVILSSAWGTLLDGTTYPLSVGSLGLGAPGSINQTFTSGGGRPSFNGTLLPGWLSTEPPSNKIIGSNSFGMHIGSVSPNIAPSLIFGGFDQNRALGTVSVQQGSPYSSGAIDLLDISLSVIAGGSPWNFHRLDGLLASGNSSIGGNLPVAINSLTPYLHLPKSTCDAIAAQLPVTYQEKYGLYFWDTSNPQYENIVSSTSCLSFSFRESETNNNFTINVPFKLLNLTLTAPLTTNPTQYFPCKAETHTYFQLGRAFLQAAFVGANWGAYSGNAAWWLAQAPGPNIPSQVTILNIGSADTTITGSANDWSSTWKGSWAPLAQSSSSGITSTSPTASNTPTRHSSGLSTGAKAGIGVGIGLFVIMIAALVYLFIFWTRHHKKPSDATPELTETHHSTTYDPKPPVFGSPASPAFNSELEQARRSIHPPFSNYGEVEGTSAPYELH